MASFRDSKGRSWQLDITVATFKRVKSLLGFDLATLVDGEMSGLREMISDPVRLVDVLYVCCKPQADTMNPRVSDEEFGESMAGDALAEATEAFVDSYLLFYPDPQIRAQLRKAWDAKRALTSKLMERAERRLADLDLDSIADRAWQQAVAQVERRHPLLHGMSATPSGPMPESSVSTPVRSPSAS